MKKPASREICADGMLRAPGPMSTGRPVCTSGMTCRCHRSLNATHLPSGDRAGSATRSMAHRSVPGSVSSIAETVNQKCSRPIGSVSGTIRPS